MKESMKTYRETLDQILERGHDIKIRGEQWREDTVPILLLLEPQEDSFFEKNFPKFSLYLAQGRVDYIASDIDWDKLKFAFESDINTRQAILYMPDWWWTTTDRDRRFEHLNCILAYQFMFREEGEEAYLHVFMRSSDFFNAFPYDWFAAGKHLEIMSEYLGTRPKKSYLFWHISNVHIRLRDMKKARGFLGK